MIAPARKLAFQVLRGVALRGAWADYLMSARRALELDRRDHALATELVYGTLRRQGNLDGILAAASARPWAKVDPTVRVVLRLALYQLRYLDRIPPHAVVHDAVELTRELGAGPGGFVNAVLRRLERERPWRSPTFEAQISPWERVSLPEWLWLRWSSRFGAEQAAAYAQSLNEPPPRTVRLEPGSETGPFVLSEVVPGTARLADDASSAPPASRFQDEASQLVPLLFGPLRGATVWDACAAPGGKTAVLLEQVGPGGRVVASEPHRTRLGRMQAQIGRAHSNLDLVRADAARPPFSSAFDAVLADVPCTGLGTLRRNPEIKWRIGPEAPAQRARGQGTLLRAAAHHVRSGGLLLYSTCSTEPEENEEVVAGFLRERPEFELLRPAAPEGAQPWITPEGWLRTFPSTRGWDGFFAALMGRRR